MTNRKNTTSLISVPAYEQEAITDLMKGEYHRVTNVGRISMPAKLKMTLDAEDGTIQKLTDAGGNTVDNPTFARALASEADMAAFNMEVKEAYNLSCEPVSAEEETQILESIDADIKTMEADLQAEFEGIDREQRDLNASTQNLTVRFLVDKYNILTVSFMEGDRVLYELCYDRHERNHFRFQKSLQILNRQNMDAIMGVWAGLPYGTLTSYSIMGHRREIAAGNPVQHFLSEAVSQDVSYSPAQIHSFMGNFPIHALARFVEGELTVPLAMVPMTLRERVLYRAEETDFKAPSRVNLSSEAVAVVNDWWKEKMDTSRQLTQDTEGAYFVLAEDYKEPVDVIKSIRSHKDGWLFLFNQSPNFHIWPCEYDVEMNVVLSCYTGEVVIFCDPASVPDIALEYNLTEHPSNAVNPNKFLMRVPRDIYIPELVEDLEKDARVSEVYANRYLRFER